ncbi:poly(A) RNA polymerase, mitochondrial, partial [Elysia marginata]
KGLCNSLLLRLYATDERVRHVVFALRLWAKFRGLSGGVGGSTPGLLTSYALTLLALFYLMRCKPEPVLPAVSDLEKCVPGIVTETVDESECLIIPQDAQLPASKNFQTSAELLQGFFQFYSEGINWSHDAILMKDASIEPRATLTKNFNYLKCRVGSMTVIDPFNLAHNVVGNVNENFRERLAAEIKRAAKLTSRWSGSDPLAPNKDKPVYTGLIDLFELGELDVPNQLGQNRKARRKNRSKNDPEKGKNSEPDNMKLARMEGEQENGEFHIILPMSHAALMSEWLSQLAEKSGLSPAQCWLNKAKDLTLRVLEKVFLAELQVEEKLCQAGAETAETTRSEAETGGKEDSLNMKKEASQGVEVLRSNASSPLKSSVSSSDDEEKEGSIEEWHESSAEIEMEIEKEGDKCAGHGKKRSSDNISVDERDSDELSSHLSENIEMACLNAQDEMPTKRLCFDRAPEKLSTTAVTTPTVSIAPSGVTTTAITASTSASCAPASSALYTPSKTLNNGTAHPTPQLSLEVAQVLPGPSSFLCLCRHPIWHGRKKVKMDMIQYGELTGSSVVDFETEITNRCVEKLTASATTKDTPPQQVDSGPAVSSTAEKHNAEHNNAATEETGSSLSPELPVEPSFTEPSVSSSLLRTSPPSAVVAQPENATEHSDNSPAGDVSLSQNSSTVSSKLSEIANDKSAAPSILEISLPENVSVSKDSPDVEEKQIHGYEPEDSNVDGSEANSDRTTPEQISNTNIKRANSAADETKSNEVNEALTNAKTNADSANSTCGAAHYNLRSGCPQAACLFERKKKRKRTSSKDPYCVKLSCELLLNKGDSLEHPDSDSKAAAPTHLLIKLRPHKDYTKQIKIFYDIFRSILLRINSTELNGAV